MELVVVQSAFVEDRGYARLGEGIFHKVEGFTKLAHQDHLVVSLFLRIGLGAVWSDCTRVGLVDKGRTIHPELVDCPGLAQQQRLQVTDATLDVIDEGVGIGMDWGGCRHVFLTPTRQAASAAERLRTLSW